MSNVMTEVLHTRVAYQLSVAKWFMGTSKNLVESEE